MAPVTLGMPICWAFVALGFQGLSRALQEAGFVSVLHQGALPNGAITLRTRACGGQRGHAGAKSWVRRAGTRGQQSARTPETGAIPEAPSL